MEKILVCDDDRKIIEIVKAYLMKEGYQVETALDGEECLEKVSGQDISLIVLDVMMPKMDGFEACKKIRLTKNIPIILLTARVEEADRVLGLELGADDYVVKPFSPRELVARVRAHLRRCRYDHENSGSQINQHQDLTVNITERRVYVGDDEISLTPKEFDLLLCMAKHPGRVYSRDMLYELVWGDDSFSDVRTVDVHVTRLRNKLEQKSAFQYISTVWSIGYRFEIIKK